MLIHLDFSEAGTSFAHQCLALIEKLSGLFAILVPLESFHLTVCVFVERDFGLTLASESHRTLGVLVGLTADHKGTVLGIVEALFGSHIQLRLEEFKAL